MVLFCSRFCAFVLTGQVITGSYDSSIKLWDLRKGKVFNTLTFHKKGVRCDTRCTVQMTTTFLFIQLSVLHMSFSVYFGKTSCPYSNRILYEKRGCSVREGLKK